MRIFKLSPILFISSVVLVGCQTTPTTPPTIETKIKPPIEVKEPESKVKITPYPDSGIKRESQPLPQTSTRVIQQPPRVVTQPPHQLKDGKGIPAYSQAMKDYTTALSQNRLSDAERSLLQAQRMAPQSADVYRELARLSNLRKQASSAEAFARKGLTFAQTNIQVKQLWQQILQSAQLQNNPSLIQQAQREINKLN